MKTPFISSGQLTRTALQGQVAVVTGAGRDIGFETAHALAWLGAGVVVAEIDRHRGKEAAACIEREMGAGSAAFVHTDVGDEGSVRRLAQMAQKRYGKVDIVLNNATNAEAIVGAGVKDAPLAWWDAGYRVNLRGPALLARAFLQGMLEQNYGVFVCVASSGSAPTAITRIDAPLETLARFYAHMQELARGYVKDPATLQEHLKIVHGWQETAGRLAALVSTSSEGGLPL